MSTLRAREIFNNSALMLIAVESVDFRHNKTGTSCQLFCNIEPIAVIICGPDTSYALDMKAKPATIDQLRQDVPGMDAIITAFSDAQ